MTLGWDVLAAILAMALATYLCRAGGYALLRATRPPPFVTRMLQHLPGCIFMAFLVPALAQGGPAFWVAAGATVATQAAFRRLALSIAAGVAVLWLLAGAGQGRAGFAAPAGVADGCSRDLDFGIECSHGPARPPPLGCGAA